MSSLKSRLAPTLAEHEEALAAALVEVAGTSFFAFAVRTDAEHFAGLARNPPSLDSEEPPRAEAWLVTTVRFDGALAGHVELAAGEGLARQLLAAFCGLPPDETVGAAQLEDALGEFGEQVSGTWLTHTCRYGRFDLQPPRVTRPTVPWLPVDPLPAGEGDGEVLACVNDAPVRLRVHLDSKPT